MESEAVFEQRVVLTPKEINFTEKKSINVLILSKLRELIENKCSKHGFVLPGTIEILSRSLGRVENGRFTGAFVYQVQARGKVLVPVDGAIVRGTILKKNKMGLYVYYRNAFRIMIPRDFHLGDSRYESLKIGDEIAVELKKSRFQINDNYIISVGVLVGDESPAAAITDVEKKVEEKIIEEKQPEVESSVKKTTRRIIRKPAMLSPIIEELPITVDTLPSADEMIEA
jgi:DNA-directed RNA polymerase subunit E'/Rpb7